MAKDQQTDSGCASAIDESVQRVIDSGDAAELRSALASEAKQRRRAECLANIQTEITKYMRADDLRAKSPPLATWSSAKISAPAPKRSSRPEARKSASATWAS